jgi:carboxypeptidase PM20D1
MKKRVKQLAKLVLALALVLLLVLVVNAARMRPAVLPAPGKPPADPVDANAAAEHLAAAVRIKTVSHEDPKDDDAKALDDLRAFLEATYPKVHAQLAREIVSDHSYLFTWKGSDPTLAPVLFAAHQDVVPVEPGSESSWTHAPFGGEIADGFVWGRGAIDDKIALVAILEAAEILLGADFHPKRTIHFAFGHDEEVGGANGAKKIAEKLRESNAHLAWVLDEGGAVTEGVIPDVARPVAVLGVSEKGYVSLELTAKGKAGHSSMPPTETTIGILSNAVARLEAKPMRAHFTEVSRRGFELLGPEMPFSRRIVMANLWLLEPAMMSVMMQTPQTAATVRTTIAPTIIEGGVKENVLPSHARAVVNFRILPGDTVEGVLAHVRSAVADDRVEIKKLERMVSEPAPIAPMSGPYDLISETIRELNPDAIVIPSVLLGASDGRWYGPPLSDGVYHFGGSRLQKTDLARVHGIDERASVAGLEKVIRWYAELLRKAAL